jgi:4-hydroxy-3-methylbut-2-en-1-yl diphosphate reductase
MKIIRAEHLGMCFGVRDAIQLARARAREEPLTILGELVHNESVLTDLAGLGIRIETDPRAIATRTVMVTAHGTSRRTLESLHRHGAVVLEATCPLVHHAHRALLGLVDGGFHPVIIGLRQHVEVRGLTGDLESFDVVLTEDDVHRLQARDRYGVMAQTTQPIDRVRSLVGALERRFPHAEVRFVDTVCQPTKQRQQAAVELARQSDVVLVIGGLQSNNTRELVGTCRAHCGRVHHIQTAGDLRLDWFANARTIGLTAGTSTPDRTVDAVEQRLRELVSDLPTRIEPNPALKDPHQPAHPHAWACAR